MRRSEPVEQFFQLSLLGLVTSGFLAVAGSGFLDTPTVVLVCLGLLLRASMVVGLASFEIPDLVVNVVTVAYIAFFAADYFLLSGGLLGATVHLVFFLAVMKIITARTNRDYLYTAAIALMELVAAAMLSVSFNFFGFLACFVVCAIAAFTSAEIRRALARPGRVARTARIRFAPRLAGITLFITAGILTLTVGMFVLLPRSANAAFRRFVPARFHLTGFSSEVTLGQIGEIEKNTRAIMHVRPYSKLMPADLKWRGAVLSHFDGKRWSDISSSKLLTGYAPIALADARQRSRSDGQRVSYGVDLNMGDADALFVAGVPEFLNIEHVRVRQTATGTYRIASSASDHIRYEISSFLPRYGNAIHPPLDRDEQQRYLQLPPLDPRIPALARDLSGSGHDVERAARLARGLRTRYAYTLDLPAAEPADPLANFLFERKRGHCEYFASAMTVMLRSLGIPARMVNGFQSGSFNPISGLYVIRESDAHSWVEAFLPGLGWTVFDPTPSAPRTLSVAVLTRFSMLLDAAETFWQDWVVNYDLNRQITLAQKLEERTRHLDWSWRPDWRGWRTAAAAQLRSFRPWFALLLLAPFVALFRFRRLARKRNCPQGHYPALYRRMLRIMHRRGFGKPPWFTPAEFAATLPPSATAVLVGEFTAGYQALRYGGDRSQEAHLSTLLDELEKV